MSERIMFSNRELGTQGRSMVYRAIPLQATCVATGKLPMDLVYLNEDLQIPASVPYRSNPSTLEAGKEIRMRKVSNRQKRNFEVDVLEDTNEGTITWDNDYPYSSIQLKGAAFTELLLKFDDLMPNNVRYQGGGILSLFLHTLRVSEVLRDLRIASERVLGIYRLMELPINQGGSLQIRPTVEAKKALLRDYEIRNGKDKEIARYMDTPESDPAVLVRMAGVPWRIEEMLNRDEVTTWEMFFQNFAVTNERLKKEGSNTQPFTLPDMFDKNFSSAYFHEVYRYLSHIAHFVGKQVGTLHAHGLTHGYLHPGNIDATGYLMDLDSVKGEKVGEPTSNEEFTERMLKDNYLGPLSLMCFTEYDGISSSDREHEMIMQYARGYISASSQEPLSDAQVLERVIPLFGEYALSKLDEMMHFPELVTSLRSQETKKLSCDIAKRRSEIRAKALHDFLNR